VFRLHTDHMDFQDFNYFLQSQILWDEGMAESAHQFMAKNPEYKMVILTGNGHIRHRYGIPERLYRRNHEPFTVVVQDEEIEYGSADYVLMSTELKGRKSPLLGVIVEEKDQGLVVMGIRDNTPARKAGLRQGDIIIRFAGKPIRSLGDLKRTLFFSEMGSTLEIRLKRNDKPLVKEIELFDFERSSP
jgi:aminopeptidase N